MCLFGCMWKESKKKNGALWYFHPQREKVASDPCSSSTCPIISQLTSFSYDPGAFQAVANVLGLWVSEFVCDSFKNILGFPQPFSSPGRKPLLFFKARCDGCSSFQCTSQCGNLSLLMGNLHSCDIPPICGWLHWGCGFWLDCVSVPPTHLDVPFLYVFSCRKSVLFC